MNLPITKASLKKIILLSWFFMPLIALAQIQGPTANNKLYTNNAGVGIGTDNPSARFEIIKAPANNYSFVMRDALNGNDSYLYHSYSTNYHLIGSSWNGTGTQRKLGFAVGNNDSETDLKLSIDNSGRIGIGSTAAAAKFHIFQSATGWSDGIRLQYASNFWDIVADDSGNRLTFGKNQNSTQGFSMWNGKFGVGTLNPQARLYVNQLGGTWADGIRLGLGAYEWDIVSDTNGERLLIARGQNTTSGISIYNGKVGIGTGIPDAKLAVDGTIHAEEVKVDLNVPGPDYVFEKNYDLKTLVEVEDYINQNKHLPEIPAAKEMEQNGINLGEMNMLLLKKVEELTLYLIELKKENEEQRKASDAQQNRIKVLEEKLK